MRDADLEAIRAFCRERFPAEEFPELQFEFVKGGLDVSRHRRRTAAAPSAAWGWSIRWEHMHMPVAFYLHCIERDVSKMLAAKAGPP